MSQSLPSAPRVELRATSGALREATLARADAAVLMLPAAEARAALASLPHPDLWRQLYRAGRRAEPQPVLTRTTAEQARDPRRRRLRQAGGQRLPASATRRPAAARGAETRCLGARAACSRTADGPGSRGARGARERGARDGRTHAGAPLDAPAWQRPAPRAGRGRRARPGRDRRGGRGQSPCPLARDAAAQRARCRGLPAGPSYARNARRLGFPLLRRAQPQPPGCRRLPRSFTRQ